MKQIDIVAKARGIVILNGVAYTPSQTIPSPLDEKTFNAIKDNIIIESFKEIGGEPIKNDLTNKPVDNKPKKEKKVVEQPKKVVEPKEEIKEEIKEESNTSLDELFE